MKIRKAIIPAAGMGTRMLPATIAVPKEMLTIVDKPVIQYVVEEAVSVGITDILIIISKGKEAIKDHFNIDAARIESLKQKGKHDLAEELQRIKDLAQLTFIYQDPLNGLGDAILYGQSWIADEPFAILLGDSIMHSHTSDSVLDQLVQVYDKYKKSVVAISQIDKQLVYKYGVLDGQHISDSTIYIVNDWIEKPNIEEAPSDMVISGLYILTPDIFTCLEHTTPGYGGEIQLTDAMRQLLHREDMYAIKFAGERFDVGNKLDFVKTNIILGLEHKRIGPELHAWINIK